MSGIGLGITKKGKTLFPVLILIAVVFAPLAALLIVGPGETPLMTIPHSHWGFDAELTPSLSEAELVSLLEHDAVTPV
ncbi:MAG: hypothetical protein EBV41_02835 [Actinobacteria bacterium]|nr:hypothetical protein [Actinomycetota bacterium]